MSVAAVVLAPGVSDLEAVSTSIRAALDAELDEVVVVGGAADLSAVVPGGVTLLRDDDWRRGSSASLRVALDWCGRGHHLAVVVAGADQGHTAATWRAVAGAPGGPIVVATYGGRRAQPVRLDAEIWALLPSSGEDGFIQLADRRPDLVTELACDGTR